MVELRVESPGTGPKPFVFVLMPFDTGFADTYKFGIKGAATDVDAYAERVDEQMYTEGILERIFNQIAKADVIVADMTGRNANVFYEVGYAHALNKVVVLLTQNAADIPFDLQHRPHIVYEGSIDKLRAELTQRLAWAIAESQRRSRPATASVLALSWNGDAIPATAADGSGPVFRHQVLRGETVEISMQVTNKGAVTSQPISHVYLFGEDRSISVGRMGTTVHKFTTREIRVPGVVETLLAQPTGSTDTQRLPWRYRLDQLPAIPPGAVELLHFGLSFGSQLASAKTVSWCLRLHVGESPVDFPFQIAFAP